MATESPDEMDIDPMNNSLANILIQTAKEDPVPFKKNTFRPFLLFGERIPNLHRPGLYLHLVIVSLQFLFYKNTQEIINFTLDNITLENNVTESLFKNDFSKPLLASVSYLLIPFIVYFCDRQKVRRYYLVFSSILMGFIAGCILLILLLLKHFERETLSSIISGDGNFLVISKTSIDVLISTFCLLSYLLFTFSFALSYPFLITFGLDILHGTQYEMLLLYFPLFYISRNVGISVSYLVFFKIVDDYPYIHCAVTTFVTLIALLLTVLGRWKGYFKDSAVVANNFSFHKGLIVFLGAFKRKFIFRNKPNFQELMLLTARKKRYGIPHDLVDKTLAMIKINSILMILIPLLGSYQILEQLYPQQAYYLNFLAKPITNEKNTNYYCNSSNYFLSYWFFNPLTIVILGPFIEYFFYDIIFDNKRIDLPCWVNCISLRIRFIRVNCGFRFRERLRNHFTLVDPLLKRVFWGLPFGLLSTICALIVEVLRIEYDSEILDCGNNVHSPNSLVPLITQIPQYIFSGILEAISTIGLLQYTYYLCSKHFQNSLKGFFFSLFFFYYGLAGCISNIFNFSIDQICFDHCRNHGIVSIINDTTSSWCLIDSTNCETSLLSNTWAIWVIVISLYLIMIPVFYYLSHKNHWKKVIANQKFLQELDSSGEFNP